MRRGAGAEAIFGIAGEVADEHSFFVEKAEDDQGDNSIDSRQRPPGAERKRGKSSMRTAPKYMGWRTSP